MSTNLPQKSSCSSDFLGDEHTSCEYMIDTPKIAANSDEITIENPLSYHETLLIDQNNEDFTNERIDIISDYQLNLETNAVIHTLPLKNTGSTVDSEKIPIKPNKSERKDTNWISAFGFILKATAKHENIAESISSYQNNSNSIISKKLQFFAKILNLISHKVKRIFLLKGQRTDWPKYSELLERCPYYTAVRVKGLKYIRYFNDFVTLHKKVFCYLPPTISGIIFILISYYIARINFHKHFPGEMFYFLYFLCIYKAIEWFFYFSQIFSGFFDKRDKDTVHELNEKRVKNVLIYWKYNLLFVDALYYFVIYIYFIPFRLRNNT